jgi:hypothetical protein
LRGTRPDGSRGALRDKKPRPAGSKCDGAGANPC